MKNEFKITHKGVTCDVDCAYFDVVIGGTEDTPFVPFCKLFQKKINESLQRADECLAADIAYQKKLEIHKMRSLFSDKPVMLRLMKKIDYSFDPSQCKNVKELCDSFVNTGKVTMEELREFTGLSKEDFDRGLSDNPYPYIRAAFKKVFNIPLGEPLTLEHRLKMSIARIH